MKQNENENKNPYSLKNREHNTAAERSDRGKNNVKGAGIVTGGLLVGIAALYGLKYAGILPTFTLLHPGTLTLIPIVPALISIVNHGPGAISTPALLISLYMLAATQRGMGFMWNYILPSSLLIIGLSILSRSRLFSRRKVVDSETGMILRFPVWRAVLTSKNTAYTEGTPLPGAFMLALCGGLHSDLSISRTEDEVLLDVTAVLGTVDITLPEYCNIDLKNIPIAGTSKKPQDEGIRYTDAPTFRIRSRTIFGTIEVRRSGNV